MAVNVCKGEVVGSRSRGGQGEEGFWTYSARLAGPADLENTLESLALIDQVLQASHFCC